MSAELPRCGSAAPQLPQRVGPHWRLPGIANLHSHAFQRAMAGLAERQNGEGDSFWSWREWMYRFAARLDPETQYAIARQLYIEMLEAGYTAVTEFHYLHHAPDGRPYAPATAMADALIAAASEVGIRLCLLPVLYQRGGFDDRPLTARQRRFGFATADFLRLHEALRARRSPQLQIGLAFHSLRAVDWPVLHEVLDALGEDSGPIHLHLAEQQAEVEDCLARHGRRPARMLLDQVKIDARWTLVHATHLDASEIRDLAASGATVALCPSTEGNLGDGLFPLPAYLDAGGRFGIGSDSQVTVSPVEELRWLEYGQRLHLRRRNLAARSAGSTALALLSALWASAPAATGLDWPAPEAGGDALLLDGESAILAAATAEDVLDRWIFSGNVPLLREVWVAGRRVVESGQHRDHGPAAQAYARALRRLLQD